MRTTQMLCGRGNSMLHMLHKKSAWNGWFHDVKRSGKFDDWLPNSTYSILYHIRKQISESISKKLGIKAHVLHLGCGTSALCPGLSALRCVASVMNVDYSQEAIQQAQALHSNAAHAAHLHGVSMAPSVFRVASFADTANCLDSFWDNRGKDLLVIVDKCGVDAVALGATPDGGEAAAADLLRKGPMLAMRAWLHLDVGGVGLGPHASAKLPPASASARSVEHSGEQEQGRGRGARALFLHYTDEDPELREPLLRRAGFDRVRWTSLGIPSAPASAVEPRLGARLAAEAEGNTCECTEEAAATSLIAQIRWERFDGLSRFYREWYADGTADAAALGHHASARTSALYLAQATGIAQVGQTNSTAAVRREVFAYVAEIRGK